MRIIFLGDIVGQPGMSAVRTFVPDLKKSEAIDFVIVNGENALHGRGIEEKTARELFDSGVDLITSGNHIWDKKEVIDYFEKDPNLLRPANFPICIDFPVPGKGSIILTKGDQRLGVINLMGRVHMDAIDCPFHVGEEIINRFALEGVQSILVDFHAEASSEKQAFAHYFCGRVSAVVGSHTHVQTADERILFSADGSATAYITDAGMTGPYDSVIGMNKEKSIRRFLTKMPQRFEPAENNVGLHGVLIEIENESGNAISITRIQKFLPN